MMVTAKVYDQVKLQDPDIYAQICAFASTFGQARGTEVIHLATRAQVEKFCMSLVVRQVST